MSEVRGWSMRMPTGVAGLGSALPRFSLWTSASAAEQRALCDPWRVGEERKPRLHSPNIWGRRVGLQYSFDFVGTYVRPPRPPLSSWRGGDHQQQSSVDLKTSWLRKTAVTQQLTCHQRPSLPRLIIFWLPVPCMNSFPAQNSYNGLGFHI